MGWILHLMQAFLCGYMDKVMESTFASPIIKGWENLKITWMVDEKNEISYT